MDWADVMEGIVLTVFNAPVIAVLLRLPFVTDLRQALNEKGPIGGASDTTSYSRITGLVGAVVVTALYWAVGNIALYKAFHGIGDIKLIIQAIWPLFLLGSALFLPYAFNQIKSAFGASGAAEAAVAAVNAPPTTPGPSPTSAPLKLVIANLSSKIDDAAFAAAVAAIGVQVSRDFQPTWGIGSTLRATRLTLGGAHANINGAADAIVYVGDSSSDPTSGVSGAYGYHSTNYGDLPYAFIYLDVCAKYGEPWSSTLSHEVLELLADPTTVVTVNGPAPASAGAIGQTVRYDLEVCDPVQGDGYKINEVAVSNFVTKTYFGMAGGGPTTNFLNLTLAPFDVRPGGYIQYEDSSGTHQIDGAKVDAKRLAARATLGAYRRNARRTAGLQRHI